MAALSEQTIETKDELAIGIVPLADVPWPRRGKTAARIWSPVFDALDKLGYTDAVKFTWPTGSVAPRNSAKDGSKVTLSTILNYYAKKRGYRVHYSAKEFPVVYVWKQQQPNIATATEIK